MPTDTELLKFLLAQMQAGSPHMDGTFVWRLPAYTLKTPAQTPLEAVQKAFTENQPKPPPPEKPLPKWVEELWRGGNNHK